ncbi:MAG: 5,6-dimethylbenzimidazole synthase [Pseudomonadota bacterium]
MSFTINDNDREAFYRVLFSRRDVRSGFLSTPIPDEVIERILLASHHAPSVGFSQPWDFVLVTDPLAKQAIKEGFDVANAESAEQFTGERQAQYRKLKLEGILEAPLGICVTCDANRHGPVVLGRTIKPEMDTYSTVCAIQNMWLAARAENIGLGWVSILHDEVLYETLGIPKHLQIIAYLCLGYVSEFKDQPELASADWQQREDMQSLIHRDRWQG